MTRIWFWADTHFNHSGVIEYCNRPHKTVQEMNEDLISKWNNRVAKHDHIYLLGDFGFHKQTSLNWKCEPLDVIFSRLNGHKHLVVGNHDEKNPIISKLPWVSQTHIKKVKWEGMRVVCCHYALETWPGAAHGYIHLHGHSHGLLRHKIARRRDVGVDCFPDGPVEMSRIYNELIQEQFTHDGDYHTDI